MEPQHNNDWFEVNVGRLPREEVVNIAREVRRVWQYLEDVYPNGDKKQRAQIKVTLDKYEQYHFWLNHQALRLILLLHKNLPDPAKVRQVSGLDCPPEVPDFLRWDKHSAPAGSKPE